MSTNTTGSNNNTNSGSTSNVNANLTSSSQTQAGSAPNNNIKNVPSLVNNTTGAVVKSSSQSISSNSSTQQNVGPLPSPSVNTSRFRPPYRLQRSGGTAITQNENQQQNQQNLLNQDSNNVNQNFNVNVDSNSNVQQSTLSGQGPAGTVQAGQNQTGVMNTGSLGLTNSGTQQSQSSKTITSQIVQDEMMAHKRNNNFILRKISNKQSTSLNSSVTTNTVIQQQQQQSNQQILSNVGPSGPGPPLAATSQYSESAVDSGTHSGQSSALNISKERTSKEVLNLNSSGTVNISNNLNASLTQQQNFNFTSGQIYGTTTYIAGPSGDLTVKSSPSSSVSSGPENEQQQSVQNQLQGQVTVSLSNNSSKTMPAPGPLNVQQSLQNQLNMIPSMGGPGSDDTSEALQKGDRKASITSTVGSVGSNRTVNNLNNNTITGTNSMPISGLQQGQGNSNLSTSLLPQGQGQQTNQIIATSSNPISISQSVTQTNLSSTIQSSTSLQQPPQSVTAVSSSTTVPQSMPVTTTSGSKPYQPVILRNNPKPRPRVNEQQMRQIELQQLEVGKTLQQAVLPSRGGQSQGQNLQNQIHPVLSKATGKLHMPGSSTTVVPAGQQQSLSGPVAVPVQQAQQQSSSKTMAQVQQQPGSSSSEARPVQQQLITQQAQTVPTVTSSASSSKTQPAGATQSSTSLLPGPSVTNIAASSSLSKAIDQALNIKSNFQNPTTLTVTQAVTANLNQLSNNKDVTVGTGTTGFNTVTLTVGPSVGPGSGLTGNQSQQQQKVKGPAQMTLSKERASMVMDRVAASERTIRERQEANAIGRRDQILTTTTTTSKPTPQPQVQQQPPSTISTTSTHGLSAAQVVTGNFSAIKNVTSSLPIQSAISIGTNIKPPLKQLQQNQNLSLKQQVQQPETQSMATKTQTTAISSLVPGDSATGIVKGQQNLVSDVTSKLQQKTQQAKVPAPAAAPLPLVQTPTVSTASLINQNQNQQNLNQPQAPVSAPTTQQPQTQTMKNNIRSPIKIIPKSPPQPGPTPMNNINFLKSTMIGAASTTDQLPTAINNNLANLNNISHSLTLGNRDNDSQSISGLMHLNDHHSTDDRDQTQQMPEASSLIQALDVFNNAASQKQTTDHYQTSENSVLNQSHSDLNQIHHKITKSSRVKDKEKLLSGISQLVSQNNNQQQIQQLPQVLNMKETPDGAPPSALLIDGVSQHQDNPNIRQCNVVQSLQNQSVTMAQQALIQQQQNIGSSDAGSPIYSPSPILQRAASFDNILYNQHHNNLNMSNAQDSIISQNQGNLNSLTQESHSHLSSLRGLNYITSNANNQANQIQTSIENNSNTIGGIGHGAHTTNTLLSSLASIQAQAQLNQQQKNLTMNTNNQVNDLQIPSMGNLAPNLAPPPLMPMSRGFNLNRSQSQTGQQINNNNINTSRTLSPPIAGAQITPPPPIQSAVSLDNINNKQSQSNLQNFQLGQLQGLGPLGGIGNHLSNINNNLNQHLQGLGAQLPLAQPQLGLLSQQQQQGSDVHTHTWPRHLKPPSMDDIKNFASNVAHQYNQQATHIDGIGHHDHHHHHHHHDHQNVQTAQELLNLEANSQTIGAIGAGTSHHIVTDPNIQQNSYQTDHHHQIHPVVTVGLQNLSSSSFGNLVQMAAAQQVGGGASGPGQVGGPLLVAQSQLNENLHRNVNFSPPVDTQVVLFVQKHLPWEVLYDSDHNSYRVNPSGFSTNVQFVTVNDPSSTTNQTSNLNPGMGGTQTQTGGPSGQGGGEVATNLRIVRIGRPTVRDVKTDKNGKQIISDQIRTNFSEEEQNTLTQVLSLHGAVPVYPHSLEEEPDVENVIFHLFHYILDSDDILGLTPESWEYYVRIQQDYSQVVFQTMERESADHVWVHDYHLMCLPAILKRGKPSAFVGFFLHSVFPSSEIYRVFPFAPELLKGVLASNIIGFYNFQYIRHFQTACTRVLGAECSRNTVEACAESHGSDTKLTAIPYGIAPESYENCLRKEKTINKIEELRRQFAHRKVILGVDLLEERKGIPHKFLAFNKFLTRYRDEWSEENCVFLQICIQHSMDAVADGEYDSSFYATPNLSSGTQRTQLLGTIHQMSGDICSFYGSFGYMPVHFLDQAFSPEDLVPVFAIADVCLCTPLRDNLSFTAYEFVVCQKYRETPGVLILSEFTGSVQSLRATAITVNPWDTGSYADAIYEALTMNSIERRERHRYGLMHCLTHTKSRWITDLMTEMLDAPRETDQVGDVLKVPPKLSLHYEAVEMAFRESRRRLIVLGFSGTLMPRNTYFHPNILQSCRIPDSTLHNLQAICADPDTDVVVLSSVSQEVLEKALGPQLPECWLIAEGGVRFRQPKSKSYNNNISNQNGVGPGLGQQQYYQNQQNNVSSSWLNSGPGTMQQQFQTSNNVTNIVQSSLSQQISSRTSDITISAMSSSNNLDTSHSATGPSSGSPSNANMAQSQQSVTTQTVTQNFNDYSFNNLNDSNTNHDVNMTVASTTKVTPTSPSLTSQQQRDNNMNFNVSNAKLEWQGSSDVDTSWLPAVEEIFEYFAARTPGAFIHKTSCTIAWYHSFSNFARGSFNHGSIQSKELLIHLWAGPLYKIPAEVVVGRNSVEVRPCDVSKSIGFQKVYENYLQSTLVTQQQMIMGAGQINSDSGNNLNQNAGSQDLNMNMNSQNFQNFNDIQIDNQQDEQQQNQDQQNLNLNPHDFVFVAGDFVLRDEDIFQIVHKLTAENHAKAEQQLLLYQAQCAQAQLVQNLKNQNLNIQQQGAAVPAPNLINVPSMNENLQRGNCDTSQSNNNFSPRIGPLHCPTGTSSNVPLSNQKIQNQYLNNIQNIKNQIPKYHFYCATVGKKSSRSQYHLSDSDDVSFLIAKFAWETNRRLESNISTTGVGGGEDVN